MRTIKDFKIGEEVTANICGQNRTFTIIETAQTVKSYGKEAHCVRAVGKHSGIRYRLFEFQFEDMPEFVSLAESVKETYKLQATAEKLTTGKMVYHTSCGLGHIVKTREDGRVDVKFEDHEDHLHDYKPEELLITA